MYLQELMHHLDKPGPAPLGISASCSNCQMLQACIRGTVNFVFQHKNKKNSMKANLTLLFHPLGGNTFGLTQWSNDSHKCLPSGNPVVCVPSHGRSHNAVSLSFSLIHLLTRSQISFHILRFSRSF